MEAKGDSEASRQALAELCEKYWYPLYAYARHRGHSPQDAQDLTQGFFCELLSRDLVKAADRRVGKFRAFLLFAFNGFRVNQWRRQNAAKRGGDKQILSLDAESAEQAYGLEPVTDLSPDKLFERSWATAVLTQVQARLDREFADSGKTKLYSEIKVFLTEETGQKDYSAMAEKLGLTPNAIAVAVHRLRHRYRNLLREEISKLVGSPDQVEAEMRHLHAVLAEA